MTAHSQGPPLDAGRHRGLEKANKICELTGRFLSQQIKQRLCKIHLYVVYTAYYFKSKFIINLYQKIMFLLFELLHTQLGASPKAGISPQHFFYLLACSSSGP